LAAWTGMRQGEVLGLQWAPPRSRLRSSGGNRFSRPRPPFSAVDLAPWVVTNRKGGAPSDPLPWPPAHLGLAPDPARRVARLRGRISSVITRSRSRWTSTAIWFRAPTGTPSIASRRQPTAT